jgi:hypothetical protein
VRHAELIADPEAGQDHERAEHQHVRPAACHAVEDQEEEGEHQGRPEIALQEEEGEHRAHGEHRRQRVFELRQAELREDAGQAALRQLAQELPAVEEVGGQEEDDQDLDRLDRLEPEQVHLGVAAARAAAEEDQQD